MNTIAGRHMVAALLAIALGNCAAVGAEGKCRQERQAFRKAQQARRQTHCKQQKEENQALRQTLKGKSVPQRLAALKAQRETQHAENKAFCQEQYEKLVAFVKARMAAKSVPADRQAEMLAFLLAQHDKRIAHRDQQHGENMALLTELSQKADLTAEQAKAAIKAHLEIQKKENEAFRVEIKKERREKMAGFRARKQARQAAPQAIL